ncbi:MAG: flagellar hook-basal body protein [Lawsonibacter sp.]|nr:flagellar hook-basal body protein [Lawsonibacter sp.]
MDLSFYTAAAGAQQQQRRLDVHGNNIANINTYGFRAERPSFSSLLYGSINGIGDTALPRGSGAFLSSAATDFSGAALSATGYAQDYAISGDGFFALLDPKTGEYSFTRDGSFTLSEFQETLSDGKLDTKWYLSDGDGRFVLSKEGRPIDVKNPEAQQPVGIFDFVNTDGMQHAGDNRFLPTEKNGQVRMGTGQLISGSLEVSNVDLATELSKVIEAQRSFSYVLKMVQTSDELTTTVNNLR